MTSVEAPTDLDGPRPYPPGTQITNSIETVDKRPRRVDDACRSRALTAHRAFTTEPAPQFVHSLASTAAEQLGVGYSAQDWIQDADGTWWFVDLNPAGQWLFLPNKVAEQVTAAIASLLDGPPPSGAKRCDVPAQQ